MRQYIVDAFTDRPFSGNPAAVCVMEQWPADSLMQQIAIENNLSETAFTVQENDIWHLRWFTPGGEIDFCGHATLGTAWVLFHFYCTESQELSFQTQVGRVTVHRQEDWIQMNFPTYHLNSVPVVPEMTDALGVSPLEAYLDRDLLLVLPTEDVVRSVQPNQEKLRALDGLLTIVTAAGKEYDAVSRVFAPKLAVPEDPVTGSSHCMIAPYWAKRLSKSELSFYQASQRGGVLNAEVHPKRVVISGHAVLFSIADIVGVQ